MKTIVFICVLSILTTSCVAQQKTVVVHEPIPKTTIIKRSTVYMPARVVIPPPVVLCPPPMQTHVVVKTKTVVPPIRRTIIVRK
jgi:hypothetical protein